MEYTIEAQKHYAEEYKAVIAYHVENRDVVHPYSFMVRINGIVHIINDYSEKYFEKRLTACLRSDCYPFSLFHKKKHLAPPDHVAFLNAYHSRMNKRGRQPSLELESRDSSNIFEG